MKSLFILAVLIGLSLGKWSKPVVIKSKPNCPYMALYGVGVFTVTGDAAVKLCPCYSQQWMGFIGLVQEGLARKRMHALIVPVWTHGCEWSASALTHKLFGDLWHFFAHFAADKQSLKNGREKLQSGHEKGPSSEKEPGAWDAEVSGGADAGYTRSSVSRVVRTM